MASHLIAVIAKEHDVGIVKHVCLTQRVDDPPNVGIYVLNLRVITGQVLPCPIRMGVRHIRA